MGGMRKTRVLIGAILLLALSIPAFGADQTGNDTGLVRKTLTHGGRRRSYSLHLPGNAVPVRPLPVLFVLHGGDGAGAQVMASGSGYNEIADRENFIVVYPFGLQGQWNDGRGKSFRRRDNSSVDDVGFIGAVIDELFREFSIDRRRVYVMGVSNGGMMTLRLGIELGDRVAAIAAVVANLPDRLASARPVRPLPVLIMNGTRDPLVPWKGGAVRVFGKDYGDVLSTESTVAFWVKANGLNGPVEKNQLPDRVSTDGCRVEVSAYRSEGDRPPVILYAIQGGGHSFPGARTLLRYILLGNKCMDINGAQVIWDFCKDYSLQGE